ncbi:hypothetical protein [Streptomyces showdoensis]|uniref:Uncharacterized protein n=1 Tax=Streptomyces showdoensis TaxID=68268 RepID=A0A2P2GKT8_STREW|nr:hypothetical protein [Streptomyces showdoensis]KKZ72117.1 hypothetical protein VO63_20300 [Streptomyces showdoensis]
MSTTTSYGTWTNRVNNYSTSPDADVLDYINGGDSDWQELLEASGALSRIQSEYRDAIEAVLPPGISLCGDEFIGPWQPAEDEFDGYPVDELDNLDFAAMVQEIDLASIVDRNEPLTLEDIGRDELKSTAKEPAKAASKAMSRLQVKPAYGYHPHPGSGRPQALYRAEDVRTALATRPGQGARTDKAGE